MSTQVKVKTIKQQDKEKLVADEHETKGVEEGSTKRNITRKKTDGRDTGNFDSRNKKQGGHGKGKWKEDDFNPQDAPEQPMDKNDPNYDETKANYVLTSHENPETKNFDPAQEKPVYGPMLTQSEFKLQVKAVLNEYFESCDADEVIRSLEELQCKEYHPDVVKKAISISMDKHPRERELVSRLLTCLHPAPLADRDMESGFNLLLDSMDDLSTDVPEAIVSVDDSALIIIKSTVVIVSSHIFLFFRQWLPISWPAQSWTKSCLLHTCRNKTTLAQVTPSLKRLSPCFQESIALLDWNASGVLVMVVPSQNSRSRWIRSCQSIC
jgi:hypothetical protein